MDPAQIHTERQGASAWPEPQFTPNARKIFDLRYPRKDSTGAPAESPVEVIDRVASNIAACSALYAKGDRDDHGRNLGTDSGPGRTIQRQQAWLDKKGVNTGPIAGAAWDVYTEVREEYRTLLTNLDFLPNSPTWTGAGTPLGQLAACFVLPVDDDLGRGEDSIMSVLRKATLIQQTGGGNGFSLGRLRPKGEIVGRSMGRSSGPMGFARVYNATFAEIAQGGSRRGANMLVMPVWHPDIMEFVRAKTEEGVLDQFNFSVGVTDDFMEAVEKGSTWDLTFEGKVYDTVDAQEMWDEIALCAHALGDPGILFLDRANEQSPCPAHYVLEATNPCGEQFLPPYSNCCLGSINLANFVIKSEGGWTEFDWMRFAKVVQTSTQFLDDVVSANQYVPEVPELEAAAMGERRIGLGLMGLADAMARLGLRYGSPEGLAFADRVTEFARFHAMFKSIAMAKDRGPFEWIEGSIYDPALLREHGPGAMVIDGLDGKRHALWAPPQESSWEAEDGLDWGWIADAITQYGIRNACQFTFAPTGTISNVAGLEGSGCEPMFALSYVRTVMQEGENLRIPYLSSLFSEALDGHARSEGMTDAAREEWKQAVLVAVESNGGSCQGIDLVPDGIQDVFVVAADLTAEEHVLTQAAVQRHVDNAVSKTINLPNSATVEDVQAVYALAYESGCKGITIYRQGSRQLEVLSTGKAPEAEGASTQATFWPQIEPVAIPGYARSEGLAARVYPVETAHGKVQVTITQIDGYEDRPFDVRLQIGKGGNDKNADIEAIGRMISIALRSGVKVEAIVSQLEHIGGATSWGFGPNKVRSAADGVAKLLRRLYLPTEPAAEFFTIEVTGQVENPAIDARPGEVCPKCHQTTMVMQDGCLHCDARLGGCGDHSGCD